MKYFKIRELIPCVDGHCRDRRCGYGESALVEVPTEVIKNAIALVEEVLDPLRAQYGKPIKVNSGYRCPLKNKAVGGVAHSQHLLGEAADIRCHTDSTDPSTGSGQVTDELLRLAQIIVQNGRFDQMILYPTFIHVSYKRTGINRHRILKKVNGSRQYTPVLIADLIRDLKEIPGQARNEGTAEKGGTS